MAYLGCLETVLVTCSDRACTGDASMDARLQLSFEGKLWQQPPRSRRASSRRRSDKASKSAPQATASASSALPGTSTDQDHPSRAAVATSASTDSTNGSTDSAAAQRYQLESEAAWDQSASDLTGQTPIIRGDAPAYDSSSSREHSSMAAAANGAVTAAAQDSSASSASSGSSTLHANATVWAGVRLGPPLNVVPGFLISYTGGLIATAVLQALMPSVLELLARDYATWAGGEQRAALLEPTEAAAPAAELVHP